MITLKNVSKYYYNKGIIAIGFTKVNIHLEVGEFVAITGESGSGKSTLLNVISGLDSYEEGEMYINGKETSHYTEHDFEEYRRTYISNIFQNFNLVNSYTVLQNIELVLLIHGASQKDAKKRALELIRKVGLTKYKNTKASKLSGGQKQRVAIARALAKETPILIADEPTGNLDVKSARDIIQLLHDISKDKLVIIVTHNYDQVKDYVTRKITMHDGRVLEDKKILPISWKEIKIDLDENHLKIFSKIRLGVRNAFNIIPKFLLVFLVYLFVVTAVISEYAFFLKQEYTSSKSGYNNFFMDTSDTRLILKKKDQTSFNEEDYQNLDKIKEVDYIIENDLLLDTSVGLRNEETNFYFDGILYDVKNFHATPDLGRLPENDNEILLAGSKDDYYLGYRAKDILNCQVYLQDMFGSENKDRPLTVVGIFYEEPTNYYSSGKIYANTVVLENLKFSINREYSDIKILFLNHYHNSYPYDIHYQVIPSDRVMEGEVYISGDLNYLCKKENCLGESLVVDVDNLYYQDSLTLQVTQTYTKKNMENLLGVKDYENQNGAIYINQGQYQSLFDKENYQSSIFLQDVKYVEEVSEKLENSGYNVLKIKDTLVTGGALEALKIIRTIITSILVITLFFIAYFVIRIILKSRNIYFGTIRILGSTKKEAKQLLEIELFTVSNLAYFLFLGILFLQYKNVLNLDFLATILKYLSRIDYIILYLIINGMSYFISLRFARKIFKNSAMSTMREDV